MQPYEFGRLIAATVKAAQSGYDLDNALSPDALANKSVANKMLRPRDTQLAVSAPRRVSPTIPGANTRVPPLPPHDNSVADKTPSDYAREYDNWRLEQGLTPGGPSGTNPPQSLPAIVNDVPSPFKPPLPRR